MLTLRLRKEKKRSLPGYGKYCADVVHYRTVRTETILDEIQRSCTLKRSDMEACLKEFGESLFVHLREGDSVEIKNIGLLKLTVKCIPADTPDGFSVETNVKSIRCIFRPQVFLDGRKLYEGIRMKIIRS